MAIIYTQSIEEQAVNLLYLIIKDHPFIDGNKRKGSILFVNFLELNDLLYNFDGKQKFQTSHSHQY